MSAQSENIRQVHAEVHQLIDTLEGPPEGRPTAPTAALKLRGLATTLEVIARIEDDRPDLQERINGAIQRLTGEGTAKDRIVDAIEALTR